MFNSPPQKILTEKKTHPLKKFMSPSPVSLGNKIEVPNQPINIMRACASHPQDCLLNKQNCVTPNNPMQNPFYEPKGDKPKFIFPTPQNPLPYVFEGEDFSHKFFHLSQESSESDNENNNNKKRESIKSNENIGEKNRKSNNDNEKKSGKQVVPNKEKHDTSSIESCEDEKSNNLLSSDKSNRERKMGSEMKKKEKMLNQEINW